MTTLTIKPTSAGNDIQIKSGDGLTTHATFGDTSTVNMSAGSIAGATITSATTFPAGHVINTFEFVGADTSTTATTTTNTHVLGTATGTSALSSSSNKLLIHASFDVISTSTSSNDHWRLFLTGTGLNHFTVFSTMGIPMNPNWHYGFGHYLEERYSVTVLCSPATTTPTYNIQVTEAGDYGAIATKWVLFQYQEIQA